MLLPEKTPGTSKQRESECYRYAVINFPVHNLVCAYHILNLVLYFIANTLRCMHQLLSLMKRTFLVMKNFVSLQMTSEKNIIFTAPFFHYIF